ncbi:hypothetical protein P154DRAFT_379098, partial [Amniculicola lignicola CBS 123094]
KFLDCLVEFIVNKKGRTIVTYSTIRESKDSISIWIAYNKGFLEADRHVFTILEMLL